MEKGSPRTFETAPNIVVLTMGVVRVPSELATATAVASMAATR
jgi:hypothetical protein